MPSAVAEKPAPISASAVTEYISNHLANPEHDANHALALEILHSLRHEHYWTSLELHTTSPIPPFSPLPRPLISGLSPHRLYMHPDEQIELLKEAKQRKKTTEQDSSKNPANNTADAVDASSKAPSKKEAPTGLDLRADPEREWVLPTRLNEKWSMKRMAEIFDSIGIVPPDTASGTRQHDGAVSEQPRAPTNKWRTSKRVLMAIADHDSTIVYYIVQEGIVKPRQN